MDLNHLRAQWDRALAAALVVIGLIALLIGWIGISGTSLGYKQLPFVISGGLFGVVLIGIGVTLYLSADLRDEWRKLDSLDETLREAVTLLSGEMDGGGATTLDSGIGADRSSGRRPARVSS